MHRWVTMTLGLIGGILLLRGHLAMALLAVAICGFAMVRARVMLSGLMWPVGGLVAALCAVSWHAPGRSSPVPSGVYAGPMHVTGERGGTAQVNRVITSLALPGTPSAIAAVPATHWSPSPGDAWLARARVRGTTRPSNPGEFNAARYLATRGITGRAHVRDRVLYRLNRTPRTLTGGVHRTWRRHVRSVLADVEMPTQCRSILVALSGGGSRLLAPATRERLSASGIAHLVAISGLHLACFFLLVTKGLGWLGLWLWGRPSHPATLLLALLTSGGFLVAAGLPLSGGRAFIMLSGYVVTRIAGREYDLWTWLAAASMVILLAQPDTLFEPGFQLSTLAVAGIGLCVPLKREARSGGDEADKVKRRGRLVRATTGAFGGTLLPVWWHFSTVAWLALPLNLLVVPIVTLWILPWTLGAVMVPDALTPVRACIIKYMAQQMELMLMVTDWCQALVPETTRPWPGTTIAVVAALLLLGGLRSTKPRLRAGAILTVLGLASFPWAPSAPDGLSVTVLAVGEGDAIVVQDSCGHLHLVDGGPPGAGRRILGPYLLRNGHTTIDRMVITHGHADHTGGLVELPETLAVCDILTNGSPASLRAAARVRMRHRGCGTERPAILSAQPGDGGDRCGVRWRVLWAGSKGDGNSENDRSIVLALDHHGGRVMLTGDIEGAAVGEWGRIVDACHHDTVLKIPHHGRRSAFLARLRADCPAGHFVVSRGPRPHGKEGVGLPLEAASHGWWWATGDLGAIRFFHDRHQWTVHPFRLSGN